MTDRDFACVSVGVVVGLTIAFWIMFIVLIANGFWS
jgi:hypothetical protein